MNLDQDQANELAVAANELAVAMGMDGQIALERMAEGVRRYYEQGPHMFVTALSMLAAFEPNEWMREAYEQYGRSAGEPPMTQQAKREAIVNYVLHYGHLDLEEWPYRWYWRKRLPERKGMVCRVTARGKLNSIAVEFPDGFRVVTSRFAVRKRKA